MKANPSSPAWGILEARWAAIVDRSRAQVFAYQEGHVTVRPWRIAAQQFASLADGASPATVVQTAMAMFLLFAYRSTRFKSDRAFRHQLVRRIRGLVATNAGMYWDPKTRRTKRTYRDLPMQAVGVMADALVAAFGGAGLQLADLEKQREDAKRDEQRKLADALGSLK